jgi:hypothetical protein
MKFLIKPYPSQRHSVAINSVVSPAYCAHLSAFRARFYMELEISDSGSMTSGGAAGNADADADAVFIWYVCVSCFCILLILLDKHGIVEILCFTVLHLFSLISKKEEVNLGPF